MSTPAAPELTIKPVSAAYDASDARWLAQVQNLLASLQANAGPVRQEVTPVAGQKGGLVAMPLRRG